MNSEDYFSGIFQTKAYYETEGVFFESFWTFERRFQSLQRHWELNKDYIDNHVAMLKKVKGDGSAETEDLLAETAGVDIDYFPEHLRLSTITFSLSLVENLLGSLSEEVAKDLNKDVVLDTRPMPYIDRYLLWFTRDCGIDLQIDKMLRKEIGAIRELRNRYLHKIDRDIPDQIKAVMSQMVTDTLRDQSKVSDHFVDASLKRLAELVKHIELAYIKFYRSSIK